MGLKTFVINLAPSPLVRFFARPYVAGDSIQDAIQTARDLWERRGVCSTVDLLGEELETDEDVRYTVDVYMRLIEALGPQDYATLSMKPTQLGSHRGTAYCRDVIRTIVEKAASFGIPATLDMEDHRFTDMTLDIFRAIHKDYPSFGTVLQSRLFRTDRDILSLRGLKARVRICIGIYNEPAEISLQKKPEMKKKMLEQVELLFKEGHYPEIATHDEQVIREALEIAGRLGKKKTEYEVQMLMGVPREAFQDELVRDGVRVRLYVPFAEKWSCATAYCKRRLAANPAMAAYIFRNILRKASGQH